MTVTAKKPKAKRKASKKADEPKAEIVAYKAFDADWTCRGYKYEIGQTYRHHGDIEMCGAGFHACEHPLDCLIYYPATGQLAEVVLSGEVLRDSDDTKICAAEITIRAVLTLGDFIQRAVQRVFDRARPEDTEHATGHRGAASATGDSGAASATGEYSSALATGFFGSVSGAVGSALHLEERAWNPGGEDHGKIVAVWAGIVGQDGIEPGVFYTLKNGKPVPVTED